MGSVLYRSYYCTSLKTCIFSVANLIQIPTTSQRDVTCEGLIKYSTKYSTNRLEIEGLGARRGEFLLI